MKTLNWFVLLLGIHFFTSCTITKRKYLKGYYLNRHSNKPESKPKKNVFAKGIPEREVNRDSNRLIKSIEKHNFCDNSKGKFIDYKTVVKTILNNITQKSVNINSSVTSVNKRGYFSNLITLNSLIRTPLFSTTDSIPRNANGKKNNTMAGLSLTFGILSYLIVLISAIVGLLVLFANVAPGHFPGLSLIVYGFVIGGVLALLAILLGVLAINQINKKPDSFYGLSKARWGIILGSLFALITLFAFSGRH